MRQAGCVSVPVESSKVIRIDFIDRDFLYRSYEPVKYIGALWFTVTLMMKDSGSTPLGASKQNLCNSMHMSAGLFNALDKSHAVLPLFRAPSNEMMYGD
jgi:hypothetical protein